MAEEYICELEKGVWIASWDGDPGRTLAIENAERFKKKSSAWEAIEKAQGIRPFRNARVIPVGDQDGTTAVLKLKEWIPGEYPTPERWG